MEQRYVGGVGVVRGPGMPPRPVPDAGLLWQAGSAQCSELTRPVVELGFEVILCHQLEIHRN